MFARSILIGTVPGLCRSKRRLGPPRPTALAHNRAAPVPPLRAETLRSKIGAPATHTSTSARFHLQRQTQADGGKTQIPHRTPPPPPPQPPPPPPRPRAPLTLSAVFDADAQTEESTFARRNVQPSLCRSPVTGCGSESHTSIKKKKKKDSHFYSFAENSGGVVRLGKEDKKKKFILFLLLFSENFSVCDLGQRRRWVPSFKYPPLTGRRPGNDQSPFFSTFFLAYIRVR